MGTVGGRPVRNAGVVYPGVPCTAAATAMKASSETTETLVSRDPRIAEGVPRRCISSA